MPFQQATNPTRSGCRRKFSSWDRRCRIFQMLSFSRREPIHSAFTVKRFRISKSQNLDLVEEKSGSGSTLHLANPLIPGTVELIVVQRK